MRDVARRPAVAAIGIALIAFSIGAAQPRTTLGHDIPGFERFLYALGQVESGGRYDAYNPSSGAYGKYQIIPSSWAAWARQVLGDSAAPKTPENQEKVARYKIHEAWHRVGAWPPVAYWWLTGRYNTDRSTWSSFARYYVDKVMGIYNSGAVATTTGYRTVWYQETYRYIGWAGTWQTAEHAAYGGGTARSSDEADATVTFRFIGRGVAWIGPKGPTRGQAKIYVDGAYVRTIDLYSSTFNATSSVYGRSWSTSGAHTLVIKVVGTKGRPTVAIDQFKVIK